MPYIKDDVREFYLKDLRRVREVIESVKDEQRQAEMTAWFIKLLVAKVLGYQFHGTESSFEASEFDGHHKGVLRASAQTLGKMIGSQDDLPVLAGELNYCSSYMIWHIQQNARYGTRAYLKAMLLNIECWVSGPPRRKTLYVRGALSDVVDENYRRNTVLYEDEKIKENGDIWDIPEIKVVKDES